MDLTPVVMLLLRDVRHAERSTERHGVENDLVDRHGRIAGFADAGGNAVGYR